MVTIISLAICATILGVVVWPQAGLINFLNDFVTDRLGADAYWFRLYVNDVTPGALSTLASFVEANWGGYSPIQGSALIWSGATLTGNIAQSMATGASFNNTSGLPQTVFGVYVTDGPLPSKLYFAERDYGAPVTLPNTALYQYRANQKFQSIN